MINIRLTNEEAEGLLMMLDTIQTYNGKPPQENALISKVYRSLKENLHLSEFTESLNMKYEDFEKDCMESQHVVDTILRMDFIRLLLICGAMETKLKMREWGKKLPYFDFPSEWEVKMLPTVDALLRFWIKKKGSNEFVSIYFDPYGMLGCWDGPYWEIYSSDHDVDSPYRIGFDETEKLIPIVEKFLNGENIVDDDENNENN